MSHSDSEIKYKCLLCKAENMSLIEGNKCDQAGDGQFSFSIHDQVQNHLRGPLTDH